MLNTTDLNDNFIKNIINGRTEEAIKAIEAHENLWLIKFNEERLLLITLVYRNYEFFDYLLDKLLSCPAANRNSGHNFVVSNLGIGLETLRSIVKEKDSEGKTLLHLAVNKYKVNHDIFIINAVDKIIQLFMKLDKSFIFEKDMHNKTALDYANDTKDSKLILMIERAMFHIDRIEEDKKSFITDRNDIHLQKNGFFGSGNSQSWKSGSIKEENKSTHSFSKSKQ